MSMQELILMSRKYGSNPDFVLAGGGNTSYKTDDTLYIKGSGHSLSTIEEEGFVKMDRSILAKVWKKKYSTDEAQREKEVLFDMMGAKRMGEEAKRPSVEVLLHDIMPQKLILHLHPAKVNGITCAKGAKETVAKLFPEAVWIKAERPGYILASICRKEITKYTKANGKAPAVIFLENHGIFFGADTLCEIDSIVENTMNTIDANLKRDIDFTPVEFDKAKIVALLPAMRMLYNKNGKSIVKFTVNKDILSFISSKEAFKPLKNAFSPDHIVYCKAEPLYIEKDGINDIKTAFDKYVKTYGYSPKIVFIKGLGMFSFGNTAKEAATAQEVFLDAIKIAVYSESFGGFKPLSAFLVNFIKNWEVEQYRSSVSIGGGSAKRLSGKITVVTGAAQGFGKGIAEEMAAQGAYVVVADINYEGAKACADELCARFGKGAAFALSANVSDEESVKAMIDDTVMYYGGLDIFVNNAGIVRAGSLEEMNKNTFDLVTAINYTAYFLCAKYASVPMKIQHSVAPDYYMDIISISSKSGLTGSKKNFAYAGSKFGGIGLTQSFALELVDFNIKVNAVCPGNFLSGPNWTDPVKGLFVQYLNAGKVPGAKTVEDVRKYYESKVPMSRGCEVIDVARAIFYIVEQDYETGQAVPVTGGQEMLN